MQHMSNKNSNFLCLCWLFYFIRQIIIEEIITFAHPLPLNLCGLERHDRTAKFKFRQSFLVLQIHLRPIFAKALSCGENTLVDGPLLNNTYN